MHSFTRRGMLSSAAAMGATVMAPHVARAATITLRIGSDASPTDPTTLESAVAAQRVKERTDGAVELAMFPNSMLGAGADMLSPVRTGAIEGYYFSSAVVANIAPGAAISGVGFVFHDYPHAWSSMDGELGGKIKDDIRAAGLLPMDKVFDIGFRHIATNNIPVNAVDDMRGVKIRVPVSQLYVSLFRDLGTAPATMNYADVYSAIQTKVVDGLEGPIIGISVSKMYEVTNYLAITNHMWDGFWLTLNPAMWSRLPANYRDIIADEMGQAALRMRQKILASETRELEFMQKNGMKVTHPDAQAFRDKLKNTGFYTQWKEKFNPTLWAALENAAGQKLS